MGLYLCVFDEADEDIEGIDVGSYADFNAMRDFVSRKLERGVVGSEFPTLLLHSDSSGEWTYRDCVELKQELERIIAATSRLPPEPYPSRWQAEVSKKLGVEARSAFESFIDVDGEPLLARLLGLVELAISRETSIHFQ